MDLINRQWLATRHLIPPPHTGRGRPPVNLRRVLNGILWKVRTRSSWRELPSRYPSRQTCYRYYCEWKSSDVLGDIGTTLYNDLLYRGNFTPYQAVENGQIILHRQARNIQFYIAPGFQNDWRTNTALLLLQFELPNALKAFIMYLKLKAKLHPRQKVENVELSFMFSKWFRIAPLGHETYSGPEDIVITLR